MSSKKNSFKVASYNIHKGFNHLNTQYFLEKMREVIRSVDADMVFLQEVIGENIKHKNKISNGTAESQFEFLADSIWPFFAYGKNAIYSHGHHGNAVLSKFPFEVLDNIELSQFSVSQRGMLMGKTHSGVYVLCVHLGLFSWERKRQLKIIIDEVISRIDPTAPLILAGDLNDWRSEAHDCLVDRLGLEEAYLSIHGKLAKTFPVWLPVFKMDRIYFRNLELIDAACLSGSPWNALSDHCAVVAEFKI